MRTNYYKNIKVERPNLYYAKLLLEDYTSCQISELTALTQYYNHEAVIFTEYPEISKVLSEIGRAETIHLQVLGKLIELLGISPKYRVIRDDNMRIWWSPSCIDYETDIFKIIKSNIAGEEGAIKQYKKHLDLIKDDYIIAILTTIILDEQRHKEILIDIYNKLIERKKILATDYFRDLIPPNTNPKEELQPPNREFTLDELKNYYDGADGKPAYVAINGIVFDVSNVGAWGGGTHFGLYAGKNHTDIFDRHHDGLMGLLKEKAVMVGYIKK